MVLVVVVGTMEVVVDQAVVVFIPVLVVDPLTLRIV